MSTNEWYTPATYLDKVREVLGDIELDPASCAFANETVKAERYYTKEDNALMLPWIARSVWLNPPYGKTEHGGGSNLEQFTRKLVSEYENGNVIQAILLIPVNTATSWFPILWNYPICFPDFRIRFYNEDGPSDGAAFGTVFVYLGANVKRFMDVFDVYGPISFCARPKRNTARVLDLWQTRESEVA